MNTKQSFVQNENGSLPIIFALTLIPLMGVLGLAIDGGRIYAARQKLQVVVDIAALAGARQPTLSDAERMSAAQAAFGANGSARATVAGLTPTVSIDNSVLKVTAQTRIPTLFMQVLSGDSSGTPISVTGASQFSQPGALVGQACVLALNSDDPWGLNMGSSSALDANCGAYVNNRISRAINLGSGEITTTFTAVVGDWETDSAFTYNPLPVHIAGPLADPLAGLTPPAAGLCSHSNMRVKDGGPLILDPGVYCGGLEISATSLVTFRPGVYIIENGPFKMGSSSQAAGDGVFFYLAGDAAVIDWGSGARMNFKAPASGAYMGMLIWSSGVQSSPNVLGLHTTSVLQGTVYSPDTKVIIGCNGAVGASAEWTVWVVRSLEVGSGATLQVRSDYAISSTPMLDGLSAALAVFGMPTGARLLN